MNKKSKKWQAMEREISRDVNVGFLRGGRMKLALGYHESSSPKVTSPYLPEGVRVDIMNWHSLPPAQTYFKVLFSLDTGPKNVAQVAELQRRVGLAGRWPMHVNRVEWVSSYSGGREGIARVWTTVYAPTSAAHMRAILKAERDAVQRRADEEVFAFKATRAKDWVKAVLSPGALGPAGGWGMAFDEFRKGIKLLMHDEHERVTEAIKVEEAWERGDDGE